MLKDKSLQKKKRDVRTRYEGEGQERERKRESWELSNNKTFYELFMNMYVHVLLMYGHIRCKICKYICTYKCTSYVFTLSFQIIFIVHACFYLGYLGLM